MEEKKIKTINTHEGMKFVVGLEQTTSLPPIKRINFENLELDDDVTKSTSDSKPSSSRGFANYLFLGTLVFLIVAIISFLIIK